MARKRIVELIDDLDGSVATHSVDFAYKGRTYRLDLNDVNAADLDEVLAPYIAAAEKPAATDASAGARPSKDGARRRRTRAAGQPGL